MTTFADQCGELDSLLAMCDRPFDTLPKQVVQVQFVPKQEEVATPQPVQVATPQPVRAQLVPKQDEVATPQPVQVATPQPVQAQLVPKQKEAATPQPVQVATPQPVQQLTPVVLSLTKRASSAEWRKTLAFQATPEQLLAALMFVGQRQQSETEGALEGFANIVGGVTTLLMLCEPFAGSVVGKMFQTPHNTLPLERCTLHTVLMCIQHIGNKTWASVEERVASSPIDSTVHGMKCAADTFWEFGLLRHLGNNTFSQIRVDPTVPKVQSPRTASPQAEQQEEASSFVTGDYLSKEIGKTNILQCIAALRCAWNDICQSGKTGIIGLCKASGLVRTLELFKHIENLAGPNLSPEQRTAVQKSLASLLTKVHFVNEKFPQTLGMSLMHHALIRAVNLLNTWYGTNRATNAIDDLATSKLIDQVHAQLESTKEAFNPQTCGYKVMVKPVPKPRKF